MGKPTPKQKSYASVIAETLNIPEPDDTFEAHEEFLSKNVSKYKALRKNYSVVQELIDTGHPLYERYLNDLGEKSAIWITENLKHKSGIYLFVGYKNKILYIGKSLDLASRIPSSYLERVEKVKIKKIMYYLTPSQADTGVLEMLLIAENDPLLNKDGKTSDKPLMFHSGIDIMRDFKEIPLGRKGKKHNGEQKND